MPCASTNQDPMLELIHELNQKVTEMSEAFCGQQEVNMHTQEVVTDLMCELHMALGHASVSLRQSASPTTPCTNSQPQAPALEWNLPPPKDAHSKEYLSSNAKVNIIKDYLVKHGLASNDNIKDVMNELQAIARGVIATEHQSWSHENRTPVVHWGDVNKQECSILYGQVEELAALENIDIG